MAVPAESKPKTSSRGRKPKSQAEVEAKAEVQAAQPVEPVAEVAQPVRGQAQAAHAQPETEGAAGSRIIEPGFAP